MNHGSNDDVNVNNTGVVNAAELSKQTSNLMDKFHGYMNTMGSEEDNSSSQKEGGGDVEEGHVFKDTPLLINGDFDYYGNGLLKDFSIKEEDKNLVRYQYAWLCSKQDEQSICMIVLESVLISIISGVSKAKKECSLPNRDKQLDEILEEDKKNNDHINQDGSIMATPSKPLQRPPEVPFYYMNVKPPMS